MSVATSSLPRVSRSSCGQCLLSGGQTRNHRLITFITNAKWCESTFPVYFRKLYYIIISSLKIWFPRSSWLSRLPPFSCLLYNNNETVCWSNNPCLDYLCVVWMYCVEPAISTSVTGPSLLSDKAEIFLIKIPQQSSGYPRALETKILFHLPVNPIRYILDSCLHFFSISFY